MNTAAFAFLSEQHFPAGCWKPALPHHAHRAPESPQSPISSFSLLPSSTHRHQDRQAPAQLAPSFPDLSHPDQVTHCFPFPLHLLLSRLFSPLPVPGRQLPDPQLQGTVSLQALTSFCCYF